MAADNLLYTVSAKTSYTLLLYLLLFVLHGHLEPRQRVTHGLFVPTLAEDGLDLLRAAAQVHQLAGEVHALLHQAEVLVLSADKRQ